MGRRTRTQPHAPKWVPLPPLAPPVRHALAVQIKSVHEAHDQTLSPNPEMRICPSTFLQQQDPVAFPSFLFLRAASTSSRETMDMGSSTGDTCAIGICEESLLEFIGNSVYLNYPTLSTLSNREVYVMDKLKRSTHLA